MKFGANIMHLKKLIFILIAGICMPVYALQQSKARTAGNFALAALKKGAGAMKANPYTAAAATTAIVAGKYVHYRYSYHDNYAKAVERAEAKKKLAKPKPFEVNDLPETMHITLPDGTEDVITLNDTADIYTFATFKELIQDQAKNYDCCIIARVRQNNGHAFYFDAFGFNAQFFNSVGHVMHGKWGTYQIPQTKQPISRLHGIEYYIYDYRHPKKGFKYLCSFNQNKFFNDNAASKYFKRSHTTFLDIFSAHQTNPSTTLAINKKIDLKKRFYGENSPEVLTTAVGTSEAKVANAKDSAQRARNYHFSRFLSDYFNNANNYADLRNRHARTTDLASALQILGAGSALTGSLILLELVMFNFAAKAFKIQIRNLHGINSFSDAMRDLLSSETNLVTLQNWQDVALFNKKTVLYYILPTFGRVAAVCLGASLYPMTALWLAERDRLARTAPAA